METLNKEFTYFINHQGELVKKYNNKFIVIINQNVVGAYNSLSEAYREAKKSYDLGTFLIQHCLPGKSAYTQTYHSGVSFS